jgi:hypothetical protein
MPPKNQDLHGNAPDKAVVALVLIDVINDMKFAEGDRLLEFALPTARQILELKRRAKAARIPIIYVNDNFGRWQSNFRTQIEHRLNDGVRGKPVAELLLPDDNDHFVLKPKHSRAALLIPRVTTSRLPLHCLCSRSLRSPNQRVICPGARGPWRRSFEQATSTDQLI